MKLSEDPSIPPERRERIRKEAEAGERFRQANGIPSWHEMSQSSVLAPEVRQKIARDLESARRFREANGLPEPEFPE
jgi:hypothetical protein